MNPKSKLVTKDQIFNLYKNVKYLRENNGLSAKQIAIIINIKEKQLLLSENCKEFGYFNDEHIKKLCAFFKITPNALFRKRLWERKQSEQR